MTRFEKEIKHRFSNIDIQDLQTGNPMINLNHRKCRIKHLYKIIILVDGIRRYI